LKLSVKSLELLRSVFGLGDGYVVTRNEIFGSTADEFVRFGP